MKPILSVGLTCLDIVVKCNSFPLEDSDQRCISHRWARGGNASNTCTVLAHLKFPCEFLGTLATDLGGKFMKEDLEKYKIVIEHCKYYKDCDSPMATAIINQTNGSRTILHSNRNLPEFPYVEFIKLDLSQYSWIHFEGRNISQIKEMIKWVNHHNASIGEGGERVGLSVELEKPKPEVAELLHSKVDLIVAGKDFMQLVHPGLSKERAAVLLAGKLPHRCHLVVPWGDQGAVAIDGHDKKLICCPPYDPGQVIDTLGAGDTFIAGLLAALVSGCPLATSLQVACFVAGTKCGMDGYADLKNVRFFTDDYVPLLSSKLDISVL